MRRIGRRERHLLDGASRELTKPSPALPDPFAPDAPYVCAPCRRAFTGEVFEQYDTGAPICPDCWREGKR